MHFSFQRIEIIWRLRMSEIRKQKVCAIVQVNAAVLLHGNVTFIELKKGSDQDVQFTFKCLVDVHIHSGHICADLSTFSCHNSRGKDRGVAVYHLTELSWDVLPGLDWPGWQTARNRSSQSWLVNESLGKDFIGWNWTLDIDEVRRKYNLMCSLWSQ